MPELPDITVYLEAPASRIVQQRLERVRLASPFLLHTVDPPLAATHGTRVHGVCRIGKRIVIALDDEILLVLSMLNASE